MRKALAAGLPIDPVKISALGSEIDENAPIQPAAFDPIKNEFRDVTREDRIHYSVRDLVAGNPIPPSSPRETSEDELSRLLQA
jgi:hypothetical protein